MGSLKQQDRELVGPWEPRGAPTVWFLGASDQDAHGQWQQLRGVGKHRPRGGLWAVGSPYESSPRIFFTKAAMSVFLVLCKVKKGCSISSR